MTPSEHDDIVYPSAVPFVLMHFACFGVIASGVTISSVCLGAGLYAIRMFAIGAGYHRYFSHRAFATSRWFQFVLAVLAQSTSQKSVLWWAAKHRHHHLFADTDDDVHSPAQHGFVYAHLGWIFARSHEVADLSRLGDLTVYPELRWLHRHELAPAIALAGISFIIAGWPGLFVGFVCSTVVLYHATFCINSLAHTHGTVRYVTGDDSRNNWLLALFTFGEGWHNNHHAFQSSARQGFRWFEVDPTYYALKGLAWLGLIWNLKAPPVAVIRNEQRLGTKVIEKVAAKLALSFSVERIAAALRSELSTHHKAEQLTALIADYRGGKDVLSLLPSWAELRRQASAKFQKTPSLEQIIARARIMIADALLTHLEDSLALSAATSMK